MTSTHAQQRLRERLSQEQVARLWPRIVSATERSARGNTAFRSEPMEFHGQAWSDESNGDTLVVVVRFGTLVTLMWRRSTQPFTPAKFQVDKVEVL